MGNLWLRHNPGRERIRIGGKEESLRVVDGH
jgi:hypothetical protein